jgi:hypothetical protein
MDGEDSACAMGPEPLLEQRGNGRRPRLPRQRHGQHARRLVDDRNRIVVVNDREISKFQWWSALRLRLNCDSAAKLTARLPGGHIVSGQQHTGEPNSCDPDEGTSIAQAQPMKSLPILQCGNCEPLKAGVHAVVLCTAAVCVLYNLAAWVARRQTHLAVNTALYGAIVAWEATHVRHHLAILPRKLAAVVNDQAA